MTNINVKPQIVFLSKELKKLDLEVTNLDDEKTLLNLSKIVKKSKEFKNWSLPNAQIRYIGEISLNINVNIAAGHNNSGLFSARCTVHTDIKNAKHRTTTILASNQSLEFCFNDFSSDHINIGYERITKPTKRTISEIF